MERDIMNQHRKMVIAGNWKMNKTPNEAKQLVKKLIPLVSAATCEVVICVPYVDLHAALEESRGTGLKIGAQNCHYETSGAFTGEISAKMLAEMQVDYVIIGHSERRAYFGETDVTVNKRALACLKFGLNTIICVGETLSQRQAGITEEVLRMQTKLALADLTAGETDKLVIAYEPIWAIGTGLAATAEIANNACFMIRSAIKEIFDDQTANRISILYGGSMNKNNAAELLSQPDIDGGLIGGASLEPHDFAKIVEIAVG
jgi:triosephosphate isomerase